tara:strand:- start:1194 stop:2804 length:1611 start_codon:yes stop_codon:yes gene_type:complete
MKLAAARSLAEIDGDGPVWWDSEELDRVAAFVSTLTLHKFGGIPAMLHPWQLHMVGALLARKGADGLLATGYLCLEIGKGNAKSTTAAMIALYLLATTENSLELYSLATKREQAARIIETAGSLALNCSGLTEDEGGDIQVRHNMLRGKSTRSTLQSIASSVRTADSLEGRLYIADECGRYTDNVLGKMAVALAKPGPESRQLLMVTTPGQNRSNPYYRKRDTWEQELKAGNLRESVVVLLYGIDEEDDPFDSSVWVKGNPMLAVGVMKEKAIQMVAEDHQETLEGRSEFTREICCRYDDRDAAFVDLAFWDQCKAVFDPLDVTKGRRVVAGADLSKSHDLTAVVFAVMDDDRNVYLWGHAWTCEHELESRQRKGNMPFRQWAEEGHMTISPGETIDLDDVERYLKEWARKMDLWKINVDPVSGVADQLEQWKKDGLPMNGHPQVRAFMSPPLQKLNTMIRSAGTKQPQIRHDGWPVLRQCIRNVRVQYDAFGNPSSEKDKAAGKIDALIAAQMAVSGCMDILREPKSAYETSSVI